MGFGGDRSIHDMMQSFVTLPPATSAAASVAGTAVDCQMMDNRMVTIIVGDWVDGTHTLTISHRKLATDPWVQVPANLLDGKDWQRGNALETDGTFLLSAANQAARENKVFQVGYVGGFRYLKVDRAASGATTGAALGAIVQSEDLRYNANNPMVRPWESKPQPAP